ncbi:MAG: hypothetical protein WC708_18885 [Lentisphaeria bacterium]
MSLIRNSFRRGWLPLLVLAVVLAGSSPAPAGDTTAAADKGGWLRTWLVGGPFGMAGLSSIAPHYERHFMPVPGPEWDQYWLDTILHVTWKEYASPTDRVSLDVPGTFGGRPAFEWPVGNPGCAYAALYVTFPGQMDVLLDFEASGHAELWLNGRPVRPDQAMVGGEGHGGFARRAGDPPLRTAVTMPTGTNLLLAKLFFPQAQYRADSGNATWFKCRFLNLDGTPVQGVVIGSSYAQANQPGVVRYQTAPPDWLLPPGGPAANRRGMRLGELLDFTLASNRDMNLFVAGEPVRLQGTLKLLDPAERQKRYGVNQTAYDQAPPPVTVSWQLYDFNEQLVARRVAKVALAPGQGGSFDVDLNKLGRGHYTLYTEVWQGAKRVCQPRPKMITVVDPPTLPLPGVHSKFAHSAYYILNSDNPRDHERLLRLLALAKIRLQIGSVHDWWLQQAAAEWVALPPEKRTWPRAPQAASVQRARNLGIELVGQVGGYYRGSKCRLFANDPAKADHLIINEWMDCGPIDGPEAERIIDTYVYETVKKYQSLFRYWRIGNEMNLRGFTPAELLHLQEVTSKAMKRADPNSKLWSGSISAFDLPYVEAMLKLGYDQVVDVHDYHHYIWPQADQTYQDLGGFTALDKLFKDYNAKLPIANGEIGCYRSIFPDGARTEAAMDVRAITVAHTYESLQWIAPHTFTPLDWTLLEEDGLAPSYLAWRTAADFLEGARHQPGGVPGVPAGIGAYRFTRPSGKTVLVLWDEQNRPVTLAGVNRQWQVYDLLGRKLALPANGPLPLSLHPIYVTNGALEEGKIPTPL